METSAWGGNRLRIAGWSLAGLLLLVPAVAMQFTDEVAWGPMDFVLGASLLGALGVGLELAARLHRPGARVALAAAAVLVFLVIWAELAVGVF